MLNTNNAENGVQGRPGTGQGKDTNAYAAGFRGLQPGRGACLDKRLLIFSLLSMPLDQRRPGGRYEWRPSLKELRDLLWPSRTKIVNGRHLELSSYRPSKHVHALYSALRAINLAEVVMPDGYHWRPTIVRGYPSFDKTERNGFPST